MKLMYPHLILLLISVYKLTHASNILAVFPIGGSSHWSPYEAMLKALWKAGHNITAITSYPQKVTIKNWRDIDVSSVKGISKNTMSMDIVNDKLQSVGTNLNYIAYVSRRYCEIAHSFPEVRKLLSGEDNFQVVFTEIFGSDCDVGFAWKLKVPLISTVSSRAQPWASSRMGSPVIPSYMRTIHADFPSSMTFFERLYNTYYHLYYIINYSWYNNGQQTDAISRSFFGPDTPPVSQLIRNTSLMFINSHFSLDDTIPITPNIVEVGGIHITEKNESVPNDIKKFMDESKEGVIYFTLGSLVRVSSLSKDTINAFREAFSELPQRVLWKYELEMENQPKNVFIASWFPQKEIFKHPNLRLFITHGGRNSLIEAVHYGIPFVGIPLFFDQLYNIRALMDKGVGVLLNRNLLKKSEILSAVKTVLNDNEYSKKMKTLSKVFKDRQMSPAELVVFWTEYVIKHEGALHLKPIAAEMPWYQYLLMDVILYIFITVFSIIYFLYYTIHTTVKFFRNVTIIKTKTE